MKHPLFRSAALGVLSAAALAGCAVGPNYVRPSAPISPTFKEAAGWTPAAPADTLDRGDWWALFGDPALSALEAKVQVNNQNIIAAEAAYREARAVVSEQRAALFPTLDLTAAERGRAPRPAAGRSSSIPTARPRAAPTAAARARPIAPAWARAGSRTSGAASAGRSRAPRRWPRPATRTWRPPACRPRANSPPTTSACARPTLRSPSTRPPSSPTSAPSPSPRTATTPRSRSRVTCCRPRPSC